MKLNFRVVTDYVVDYLNLFSQPLVSYEKDSFETKYVYGYGKISKTTKDLENEFTRLNLEDILVVAPNIKIATEGLEKTYFHKNIIGTTTYVTDKNGKLITNQMYDSFGKSELDPEDLINLSGLEERTNYTGHSYDEILDSYFAQARIYEPTVKRFLAEDMVKDGLNWYSYTHGNPVNFIDYYGESTYSFKKLKLRDNREIWSDKDFGAVLIENLDIIYSSQLNYKWNPNYHSMQAKKSRERLINLIGYTITGDEDKNDFLNNYLLKNILSKDAQKNGNKSSLTKTALDKAVELFKTNHAIVEIIKNASEEAWDMYKDVMIVHGAYFAPRMATYFSSLSCFYDSSGKYSNSAALSKTFTSSDKYVGETANLIESTYPGKVIDVNKIIKDSAGKIITDYDIELDNFIIQVKSGTAKGLTTQIKNTATSTAKTVIGYTPDLKSSSAVVKGVKDAGYDIFTTIEDLLNFLGK